MKNLMRGCWICCLCTALMPYQAASAQSVALRTVYTDISEQACTFLEADTNTPYVHRLCPGTAGHRLRWSHGGDSDELAVVMPDGTRRSLDLMFTGPQGFAYLGARAEWRLPAGKNSQPVALIVRYNVFPDPDSGRRDSYLLVGKITPQETCLTDIVPPMAKANERARELADRAAGKPCLRPHE